MGHGYISIKYAEYNTSTVSEFKAWLAEQYANGTPVTVIFKRVEPVETPLSAEEVEAFKALHTYYPTTVVYNNAGAEQGVTYVADTKIYIDNKFNELATAITAIGGEE